MSNKAIRNGVIAVIALAVFLSIGIGGYMVKASEVRENQDTSSLGWEKLSTMKIYFGHQSVGYNIMAGVDDLARKNEMLAINIKETNDPADFNQPVFAHSLVGRNEDPLFKINNFKEIIDSGIGNKVNIAFFKFCYVDITRETDLNSLFDSYVQAMEYLVFAYPQVTFLYVTVPVRVKPAGIKNKIRNILNISGPDLEDGLARNRFNIMMRNKYGRTGKLFDLAKYESFYAHETIDQIKQKEMFLISAYSNDGKHLNAYGREVIAGQLLLFLSSLSSKQ